MNWPRVDQRLLIPFEFLALVATAGFTPWWSTIVVVGTLRFLFSTSVRALSAMSFVSWFTICVYRDFENLHGPSRIFVKLFSLPRLGFPLESSASQIVVFVLIGLVGFALALCSAKIVAVLQQLFARS